MKKFLKKPIVIAALVLIVGGGYYWYSKSKSKNGEVQYKTAVAEKGTLTTSVSASGNVIVDQSATVDPTIDGTVYNLSVSVGDKVKKGQLLFMIKNDELGIDASKAYASYLQSKASLETAKASKKEAKINYEDGNSKEKPALKKKLEAAEISLEAAEKNVQNSWSSYQNSLSDAYERKVVSSIDGTVNAVNIKNGDDLSRLSSNSNSSAPIIIGDLGTLKAQVEVNEVDISNVSIGQKAMLKLSAIDDLEISGKVEKMDSLGTVNQNVVTYNVTISLDTLDERIRPEMSVSAYIITDVKQNVLIIPSSALKFQGNKNYVEILNNGKNPEQVTVEAGMANNIETEIISGIKEGDQVVIQTIDPNAVSTTSSQSGGLRLPGMGGGGAFHRD